MTTALAWHSILATDRMVYHDNTRCVEGDVIALRYRRPGTGGRAACEHCARSSRQELRDPPSLVPSIPRMPSRGPALRETDEHRCPYCRSCQITPAGQILAVGELIKEAHRCEVCHTIFLIAYTAIG